MSTGTCACIFVNILRKYVSTHCYPFCNKLSYENAVVYSVHVQNIETKHQDQLISFIMMYTCITSNNDTAV